MNGLLNKSRETTDKGGVKMDENIELLMKFGLTRQEAKIYLLLITEGMLSGYEAAKRLGISRSNAYGALAGLVDKGAAYVVEEQSVRYQAIPIKEFCENKIYFMRECSKKLVEQVPKITLTPGNYITIRGRRNVLDKFRNMLDTVEYRLYLSGSEELVKEFRPQLEALIKEGKKVVLLTEDSCKMDGAIIHYRRQDDGQFRLITDSQYAMTGEIHEEMNTTCLYSSNPNLVKLLKETLANEIKLIEIQARM